MLPKNLLNKRGFTLLELALALIIFGVMSAGGFMAYEGYQRKLGQQRFTQNVLLYAKKAREVFTTVNQTDANGLNLQAGWVDFMQNAYGLPTFTDVLQSKDVDLTVSSAVTFNGGRPQLLTLTLNTVTSGLCQRLALDLLGNISAARKSGLYTARVNNFDFNAVTGAWNDVLSSCKMTDDNQLEFNFAAREIE